MILTAICLLAGLPDPREAAQAFFRKHCLDCHDSETKKGGLDLPALAWNPSDRATFDRWVALFDKVSKGEMPPAKKPRPEQAELKAFLDPLRSSLHAASAARQKEGGRVAFRRLNRSEFENSVQDLMGIDAPLKHLLPEDTPAHGFDTVAEGLRFSTLQIEKVFEAADTALDAAIVLGPAPKSESKRYSYKDEKGIRENLDTPEGFVKDPVAKAKHQVIFRELPDAVVFWSDGYSPTDLRQFSARHAGPYRIRVSAYGYQSKGRPVTLRVYADRFTGRRLLAHFDMPADAAREVEFTARLEANEHLKVVPHGTGYDDQGKGVWEIGGPRYQGVGLAVQWVEVEGPLFERWPPPSVGRLFGDVPVRPVRKRDPRGRAFELAPASPREDLRPAVERFAGRAFRRPLEKGEADGFVRLAETALAAGASFEDAARVAFRAVLSSPQFLLLEERPGLLDDHALAARLSYFLWSTAPDAELLALAAEKKLGLPGVFKAQVERLLSSPRSRRFVENFTGQWLDLRRIDATSPDARLYPEFDEMLPRMMVGETEAFFAEVLAKDLPVASFIDSDFLMLNSRLAVHYGIEGVEGESFRRVARPAGSPRGGLLAQAAILKITANGTVTSPVMRGTWVLKRLLGQPPAPPPADAGSIEPDTRGATTVREQLAKHRNVPACATCHRTIDPPGFALECFDVIGGFRDRYRSMDKGERPTTKLRNRSIWEYKSGPAVDPSGELADGRKFSGIAEFKALLLEQKEQVLRNLAGSLLVYGSGAGLEFADREVVEDLVKRVGASGGGLRTLVHEVAASRLFRMK